MIPDGPSVKEGIVTSTSPLSVTLKNDAKMILSANSLIVPRNLTDYQVEVDLETALGTLTSKTKVDGKHTHDELTGGDDGEHFHKLDTFKVRDGVLMIHNALKKGDTVYLFVAAPRDGENVICMENIFGTTVKLTDLQGNAIPYEIEDELLRFTVNAKGTAPVAVRVQI